VTIFGAGPQGVGHAGALATGGFCEVDDIAYVVRDVERARRDLGPEAQVLPAGDAAVTERLRTGDVVVCTTTSTTPLFASHDVPDHAVIAVVGAHEATWRETEGALLGRSTVVVEDRATALREAGDIVFAVREGHLTGDDLVAMADVIRGSVVPDPARPYTFKSVGMSWEDLVIAEAVMRRHAETRA
jgi:ornithine cyclodeaminase